MSAIASSGKWEIGDTTDGGVAGVTTVSWYYLSTRDIREQAGASGLPRLPAAELESAVLEQATAMGHSRHAVAIGLGQGPQMVSHAGVR